MLALCAAKKKPLLYMSLDSLVEYACCHSLLCCEDILVLLKKQGQ